MQRSTITALLLSLAIAAASAACPGGYTNVADTLGDEGHDSCIKVYTSTSPSWLARATCAGDGAHLVSILSTRAAASNVLYNAVLQAAVGTS